MMMIIIIIIIIITTTTTIITTKELIQFKTNQAATDDVITLRLRKFEKTS